MKVRLAFALVLAAVIAGVARGSKIDGPKIEFTGVLAMGDSTRFALRDAATGVSGWVKIGGSFSGYTLASFEAAAETIVLTKDHVNLRVKLSEPKPASATVTEPPPAIATPIRNNLRQLAAAADQYYLENGVATAQLSDLVGERNYVRRLVPVAGEDYGALIFKQGNNVFSVRTAEGQVVTLDLEIRPREHIIQAGDTISSIARSYGTTAKELAVLNQITDPAKLRVGDKLRLR